MALADYERSLGSRPDDWASSYSLGNFYSSQGDLNKAISHYDRAVYLRPDAIPPLVNRSMAQARLGRLDDAEKSLRKALELNPDGSGVNFNLGLLLAEKSQIQEAEACLRRALKGDPDFAEAAFNLGVLLGTRDDPEAITLLRKAFDLRPQNDRYGYTLAYQLAKVRREVEAIAVLNSVIALKPAEPSAYMLLADIHRSRGEGAEASAALLKGAGNANLDPQQRAWFEAQGRNPR